MQHVVINKYLARPLNWLLQKNVSYWHQGCYQICSNNGSYEIVPAQKVMPEKNKRPGRLIILSRWHYQEFVNHYPIARLSELKQVLKTEFQQYKHVLHYIGPLEQQRRAVCTVVVSDETAGLFDKNCLLIPESLLLWQAAQLGEQKDLPKVLEMRTHSEYFLYTGGVVPVSQRINSFCLNEQNFKLNNGVPEDAPCERVSDQFYADNLVNALYTTLPVLSKVMLFKHSSSQGEALPVKSMSIAVASVTILYFLIVAGYYKVAIDERQAELQELGPKVNHLLDKQQELQAISDEASRLARQRMDKTYNAHLWQVVIGLLRDDESLMLQNLASDNDRIVLRGQARQATEVLARLQRSDLVENARFDASVRRQKDMDMFVISLKLIQSPLSEKPLNEKSGAEIKKTDAAAGNVTSEITNTSMEIVDAAK